jgi:hypothetical protein
LLDFAVHSAVQVAKPCAAFVELTSNEGGGAGSFLSPVVARSVRHHWAYSGKAARSVALPE